MSDSIIGKLVLGLFAVGLIIGCLVLTGILNAIPLP